MMYQDLKLRVLSGEQSGRVFHFSPQEGSRGLVVGRSSQGALVLESLTVSGMHAELRFQDDTWFVADLASRNGSTLEGQELLSNDWTPLPPRGQLTFGEVTVALEIEEEPELPDDLSLIYRPVDEEEREESGGAAPGVVSLFDGTGLGDVSGLREVTGPTLEFEERTHAGLPLPQRVVQLSRQSEALQARCDGLEEELQRLKHRYETQRLELEERRVEGEGLRQENEALRRALEEARARGGRSSGSVNTQPLLAQCGPLLEEFGQALSDAGDRLRELQRSMPDATGVREVSGAVRGAVFKLGDLRSVLSLLSSGG